MKIHFLNIKLFSSSKYLILVYCKYFPLSNALIILFCRFFGLWFSDILGVYFFNSRINHSTIFFVSQSFSVSLMNVYIFPLSLYFVPLFLFLILSNWRRTKKCYYITSFLFRDNIWCKVITNIHILIQWLSCPNILFLEYEMWNINLNCSQYLSEYSTQLHWNSLCSVQFNKWI